MRLTTPATKPDFDELRAEALMPRGLKDLKGSGHTYLMVVGLMAQCIVMNLYEEGGFGQFWKWSLLIFLFVLFMKYPGRPVWSSSGKDSVIFFTRWGPQGISKKKNQRIKKNQNKIKSHHPQNCPNPSSC